MKIKELRQTTRYWQKHKEIYFNELDCLDVEIRGIVTTLPHDPTTMRFNCKIDKLVIESLQESNNQTG